MTAGSVIVPTIIPLRPPMPGLHKSAIDSNTKIELRTETKDARIHYTINGTKPDPFQRFGDKCTMQYRGPFTLPAGKQTVKAMALSGDGQRESAVVTKVFEVQYVPPPAVIPMDDDVGFQDDLERERSKMRIERATNELLRSSNSAWTDVAATKEMQQSIAEGHYPNTNQWLPTAYPPQSFHAPPNMAYTSPQSPGFDIPLNVLQGGGARRPETKSMASQTVGLFYPSQRKIDQQEKELEDKVLFEKQMRDRRPLLTAVSPGKGYWRKQIDHICAHLKAHAQNDAEFRALIGQPKMGRLITSAVKEDGYELGLTLTFALRDGKDPFVERNVGVSGISSRKGFLSQHMDRDSLASASEDELMSEDNITSRSTMSVGGRKRSARRSKAKKNQAPKLSPLDAKLIRELGSQGEGSSTEVQQLIDEGANPSCASKSGLPALHMAAKNKHIDCIPVLVQAGANANAKGPSSIKGNTALHEAVNLGSSGLKSVDALLICGADQNIKNDRGETPYEMATKAGYENLVKRFASALGQSQLQKMIRPHSSAQ